MTCVTSLPGSCPDRVYNEKPSGAYDCVNLTYTTAQKFDPDTIVIRLDGNTLDPIQYTLGVDNQSFDLLIDTTSPKALQCALNQDECLRIDYDPGSSSSCITFMT